MSLLLTGVGSGGTKAAKNQEPPEILLQAQLLEFGPIVPDGSLVRAAAIPWFDIFDAIERDPSLLFEFSNNPRKFEEFIAGAYQKAGFDEVILTSRSGDGGRDIIAIKSGYFSIRILDQVKAYKPGHLVTHDDVRSMLGVVCGTDQNSSKGIITTTSDCQPGIFQDKDFGRLIPHRLDLKNGQQLVDWLKSL